MASERRFGMATILIIIYIFIYFNPSFAEALERKFGMPTIIIIAVYFIKLHDLLDHNCFFVVALFNV